MRKVLMSFGLAILAMMALWSQLTPLGAGPDEPSNLIKSAAVIRGQFRGEDVPKWLLSIDGWAYDGDVGVRRVIVTEAGKIVGEQVPATSREDVSNALAISPTINTVFSIWVLLKEPGGPYSVYAELNDGSISTLVISPDTNVVEYPSSQFTINGIEPFAVKSTQGSVDESSIRFRKENSYWSIYVEIDPQFYGAQIQPRCFLAQAAQAACSQPIQNADVSAERVYTQMGRYTPLAFAISGVGTLVGATDLGYRLSRIMVAISSAFLLGLGAACLVRRKVSVLPLLVAITPGVVFMSSVVNPSATETCGAIALWAVLPGLMLAERASRLESATVLIAGLALIVARPLGMVQFAVVVIISVVATGSWRNLVIKISEHKVIALMHALAIMFATSWYLFVFNAAVDPKMADWIDHSASIGEQILHALGDVPRIVGESIGNFGWLDTPTPQPIALAVVIVTVAMIAVGWRSAGESTKISVLLLAAACVMLVVAQDLNYYKILGEYGSQGRHLTPLLSGLVLLGARNVRLSLRASRAVVGVWSLAIFICGLSALRRYSVGVNGDNYFEMFSNPKWRPPLGINVTVVLLAISAVAVALATLNIENSVWREKQSTE